MINRTNYEAFFLDYHEGSLDDKARKAVLDFVEANPDLREDFESFELISISEKDNAKFPGKESLKKNVITEKNYKTWLVAYEENDLDAAGRKEVEHFIELNPLVKPELEILKQTKIHPDYSIRFKNKSALKKGGIIVPMWARYAAAACVVFALLAYLMVPRNTGNEIVKNDPPSDSIIQPSEELNTDNRKMAATTETAPEEKINRKATQENPAPRKTAGKKPEQKLVQQAPQPVLPDLIEQQQEPLAENLKEDKTAPSPESQTTIVINDNKPSTADQNKKFVVLDDNDLAELGLKEKTEVENNSLLADAVNGAGKIFGLNAHFKTERDLAQSKYTQTIAMGPLSVTRTVAR